MAVSGDPVGTGLVASLARPGGNVTGLTLLTPDLAGKRLALLKEAVPNLSRVAAIWNASNPVKLLDWRETQAAAQKLGLKLQSLEVRAPGDFDNAFDVGARDRPDGLVVFPDGLINAFRTRILDFARTTGLPAMYPYKEFVTDGGLMSYAPSYPDLFRRAALDVDKILKGTKPAEIPVELPTKFEFVLNLATAKSLGLAVPNGLLVAADEVIE
jgi:putative ABC transport system substrate-binding protein